MYTYNRTVHYHETDKMGIAHHANYIKWMEEARIGFLESIGLPFQMVEAAGIGSPVTGLSVDYKRPCTFGDALAVTVTIRKYTGVKLDVDYILANTATQVTVATASSSHCFLKDGKIMSLKKEAPAMHTHLQQAICGDGT